MFSLYHNFKGKINDVSVNELVKQLDYKLETYEERLTLVENLLGVGFFEEYFDSFFKVSVSTEDATSVENNVCLTLQRITDYLLCSTDISTDLKEKKIEYKFYQKEETFKEALQKSISIEAAEEKSNSREDVIDFLASLKSTKKSKKMSVKENDYSEDKETYLAEVLREYAKLKVVLNELKANDELRTSREHVVSKGKLNYMIKELNSDMLDCKIILSGAFGQTLRNPLPEGQVVDWDDLDYSNEKHIKALLYSNATTISAENEISFLVYDLECKIRDMVKRKKLVERDLKIIDMIRKGYLQEEIAEYLGITQVRVAQKISQIARKIAKDFSKDGIN